MHQGTLGTALLALLAALAGLAAALPAHACGPDSDCTLADGRTYRVALPAGEGPFGAVLFMHGYRGTAAGVMGNAALRAAAADLGVALIAAQSGPDDWMIRNAPRKGLADDARELAYFDALLADVTQRLPVDPDRILATGFSAGGMMTWTLACRRADRFAAFMPVSGTFWAPLPADCPNPPVDLLHIHGTADEVVPLAGRAIADTRQGDVRAALARFADAGGYVAAPAGSLDAPAGLACEAWTEPGGKRLALCLHGGGHRYDAPWLTFGYRTLVGAR